MLVTAEYRSSLYPVPQLFVWWTAPSRAQLLDQCFRSTNVASMGSRSHSLTVAIEIIILGKQQDDSFIITCLAGLTRTISFSASAMSQMMYHLFLFQPASLHS